MIGDIMKAARVGVNKETIRAANSIEKLVRVGTVDSNHRNKYRIGGRSGLKMNNRTTGKERETDLQRDGKDR